jgi:predicted SnoaL-like aldol condensation-catalyzing enzyme
MKILITLFLVSYGFTVFSQIDTLKLINQQEIEEQNKKLAQGFYNDLWFNNDTDKYKIYMADDYVVHDIGERKGVTEPAVEQKIVADRFWNSGEMSGKIIYQIADGDLVATRWLWSYESTSFLGNFFEGENLPIINVFRFNSEGKIVEIWNHRHDIDTNQTMIFTIKGLLIGLLIALIPTFFAIRLKRKLKKMNLNN